jgi:hypothetical protein
VPKPLLSYLLPYSRTFNCTSKTTGSPRAEIDPNLPLTNTPRCTRILIYIDGLLSVAPLCPSRCYLTFFHERSIALVKRLAGSPKGWNWSTCPTLTKCYSKVAHAFLYIDGLLSVAPNCAQAVAILPSSIRTFNCTSKTTGWFTKGLKLIPPATLTKCYSR